MTDRSPTAPRPAPATEVLDESAERLVRRVRKVRVVVVDTPNKADVGKVHAFAQDEIRIGSSPTCDVPVEDPSVSREHLALRLVQDGVLVVDLGSTNGTFTGDVRVREIVVAKETLFALGKSTIRLVLTGEDAVHDISPRARFGRMLGASPAMRETFALLERVAPSDLTVLVEGETGTGKELVAEGLHGASGRAGELVAVNCGAIPRELLESELFGHEKGAFTGAVRERRGAFLAADKGTLFLDEIGELPLDMQAKLLRALERREVKPVGSDRTLSVDVRIVAATHRPLASEVTAGRFRQDLYYRLAVVTVRVPPLRTRLDDLPLLTAAIEDELARRRAAAGLPPVARLDTTAMAMLRRYDFPGNVRELRNIVERWAILGTTLAPGESVPAVSSAPLRDPSPPRDSAAHFAELLALPYHEAREALADRFERAYVQHALDASGGNVSKAARDAGVDRRHLQRWMARFGLGGRG